MSTVQYFAFQQAFSFFTNPTTDKTCLRDIAHADCFTARMISKIVVGLPYLTLVTNKKDQRQ